MLYLKKKDFKLRRNLNKFEKVKRIKKFVQLNLIHFFFHNKKSDYSTVLLKFLKTNFKNSKTSKTRLVRRCTINNRSKSFRPFGISRILLREMLQFGLIPGYKKAV